MSSRTATCRCSRRRSYIPKTRYAFGEEIREYLEAIADRFDLVDSALFHTGVETSEWDEDQSRWVIRTDRGDEIRARYLVMAVGILNLMKMPVIPGMETFEGAAFHSARWDYDYTGGVPARPMTNLADKAVGIIGTGASAVQAIPPLAESSQHLYVFQRTPGAVGVRGDQPTSEEFAASLRPGWHRERNENFQAVMLGQAVDVDLVDDGWCHHFARINNHPFEPGMTMEEYMHRVEQFDFEVMELHRQRIRETITDPAKADLLMPYYRYSCRRPLFHDDVPAGAEPRQRHHRRLPRRHRPRHRARRRRRRPRVRARLHRLRHRVRTRGHPAPPPRRARGRRSRRTHRRRRSGPRVRPPSSG